MVDPTTQDRPEEMSIAAMMDDDSTEQAFEDARREADYEWSQMRDFV